MQQTSTLPPRSMYEALAATLTPAEREILETLGEIIALDLLRQRNWEGTEHNKFETDSADFTRGRAC